jgi:hypothetical protein
MHIYHGDSVQHQNENRWCLISKDEQPRPWHTVGVTGCQDGGGCRVCGESQQCLLWQQCGQGPQRRLAPGDCPCGQR